MHPHPHRMLANYQTVDLVAGKGVLVAGDVWDRLPGSHNIRAALACFEDCGIVALKRNGTLALQGVGSMAVQGLIRLGHGRRQASRAERVAMLAEFKAMLSPEVLATMDALGSPVGSLSAFSYNWLLGWVVGTDRVDHELGHRRRQASEAYPLLPWLAHDIHRFDKKAAQPRPNQMLLAIDRSEPLAKAIALHYGIQPWSVRLLHGLRLGDVVPEDCQHKFQLGTCVSALRHVAPEHVPKSPGDWEVLRAVGNIGFFAGRESGGIANRFAVRDTVIRSAGGRWGDLDVGRLRAAGLDDIVADVVRNLIRPALVASVGEGNAEAAGAAAACEKVARRLMFFGRTLRQLLVASDYWHGRREDIQRRLAAAFPPRRGMGEDGKVPDWLPLAPPFVASNGWSVIPLVSQGDLDEEHAAIGHCVDGYGRDCAFGSSHILSVRDPSGRRVSTVEIDGDILFEAILQGAWDPAQAMEQHEAANRASPPPPAAQAMSEWFDAIRGRRLEIPVKALAAGVTARRVAHGIRRRSHEDGDEDGPLVPPPCYDASSPAARAAAFAAYAPLFPRAVRQSGLDGFVAHCLAVLSKGWAPSPEFAAKAEAQRGSASAAATQAPDPTAARHGPAMR